MKIDPTQHPELIHPSAYLAPSAVVVGHVQVDELASLWFQVVVRGDAEKVTIGARTNIQDGSILHADPGEPCVLGARVSLGHGAIVHAATVEDDVLVGMRAVVLNRAHIGRESIIAAGALVSAGTVIPPRSLVMGVPGKVRREVTDADLKLIHDTASHYVAFAQAYAAHHAR